MLYCRNVLAWPLSMIAVSCSVLAAYSVASAASAKNNASVSTDTMQCTPNKVGAKDTVTVTLPANHGGELAVVAPNKNYYFIAFSEPDPKSPLKPPVESDAFLGVSEYKIVISQAVGVPWVREIDVSAKPIFTQAGNYTVLVSPTLETSEPRIDGECTIAFTK